MKKIVLGLISLVSFGFAEIPVEMGYRLLANADNIYRIDLQTKSCQLINEDKSKNRHIINIWKN